MKEFSYEIKDPMGIHARPAGLLVKEAAGFAGSVSMDTPHGTADCKRIMAVMRMAVKQGDTVTVKVEGDGEEAAAAKLQAFFEENL